MPATRTVELPGRLVTIRELTVAEVRAWLLETEAGAQVDPLHALAFDDFGLGDLARMCDATADDLEAFAPSDLAPLVEACRALNPHFFRVRAALTGAARVMLGEAAALTSTGTAAAS